MLEQHRVLRRCSREVAEVRFDQIPMKDWVGHRLVAESNPERRRKNELSGNEHLVEVRGDPETPALLAETFVALHLSSFLVYGTRQIRNLLSFLPVGFVLLMISTNSYNVQSPQLIGRFLLILFVLIALVLWTCLSKMERDPIFSRIFGNYTR